MLTASQFDALTVPIVDLYNDYIDSVIADIARRLAGMDMTNTAAWQTQRIIESGALYDDVLRRLATLTGKSEAVLRETFRKSGVKSIEFDDRIYKAAGLNPVPLNLSPAMQAVLLAGLEKTGGIMRNLTMTTALTAQESFIRAADLAYLQVSQGAMSYDDAIRAAIKDVAGKGVEVIDYASGHRDQLDVAMRRTVLTGVGQTAGKLQETRADEMGQDLVETSAHIGARPSHQLWQGKVFSRSGTDPKYPPFVQSTGYGTGPGLQGWNCVIGDTLVSSLAVRTAYRRKYSGEIVIIHTASGKKLTVTPNHPILSEFGWVGAGMLCEGHNIIKSADSEGVGGICPDINNNISSIADVFNSLSVGREVFRFSVSSSDFHGDVSDSEVDVVFSDLFLGNGRETSLSKHIEKDLFGDTSAFTDPFSTNSALGKVFDGSLHSPNGIMGCISEGGPSIFPGAPESIYHCAGAVISDRDAQLAKIPTDCALGYSSFIRDFILPHSGVIHGNQVIGGDIEVSLDITSPIIPGISVIAAQAVLNSVDGTLIFVRDILQGFAGRIELDNIVLVERERFSGHVYNLHTEGEWYSANGIITHNCRHSFYPFFPGISERIYKDQELETMAGKTIKYNGQDISIYDATQVQREIERKIRYWKRQASALEAGKQTNTGELAKVAQYQKRMRDFIKQMNKQDDFIWYRQRAREQI